MKNIPVTLPSKSPVPLKSKVTGTVTLDGASSKNGDEIKVELGQDLYPFIILLDQNEEYGFQRNWEPIISDPATNYGYAFQWFLMCFCSFLFLIYRIKKSFS